MLVPSQQGLILTVIGMHDKAILQNQTALWEGAKSAFGEWLSWTVMTVADQVPHTVYHRF